MERIINEEGIAGRALSWTQLGAKAGLVGKKTVHWQTIQRTMGDLEYHKCIACTKNWIFA